MLAYIIAGIASLAVALVFYHRTSPELSHRQRIGLTAMRAVVIGLLFLFLLTPIIYYIRHYREKPEIILLKDVSASMQIKHPEKPKSARLSEAYEKLRSEYQSAGYGVKEMVFADGLNGKPDNTYFIPALEQIKQWQGKALLSGIILFSDGWFRDTDQRILKSYDVPVIAVADTARVLTADLLVSDLRHNRQGYRNELSLFETVLQAGNYKGSAKVSFLVNDKVIKEKTVSFQREQSITETFDHRFSQTGLQKLEIRISAQGLNEISLSNNNFFSAIDILNEKEKILLFTDAPNWDTKFFLDTIRDNNRLEANSYTLKSGVLFSGEERANIKSWDNINTVIIVNQGGLQIDNALAGNIINLVKRGTGLLYIGQPITQLAEVLPLGLSNIRSIYKGLIRPLPAAATYSAFNIPVDELNQIPPVDYYYLATKAQAEVLAIMDNVQKSPAIAVSSVSGGKVAAFAFLNLWRWQLQSKTQAYKSFASDVLTWLSNRQTGQLNALYEPGYYLDEPIEIKLTAIDDVRRTRQNLSPRLSVYNAKNDSVFSDFMLQDKDEYRIKFRLNTPGEYRFRIADLTTNQSTSGRFMVSRQNLEARDLGYNLPLLGWISVQTGGRLLSVDDALSYKPVKATEAERIEKREFPLYKKWYLICLFILVFCLELFFRRRWGLL